MKYKVAIIGTGYMAKKHCDMLYNHNNVILDTIVSTKKSQRISKQFIQKYGFLKNTADFDSVLEDTTIDLVIICSPDFMHATQTAKLLKAGKHVLCEKPLARTEKDFGMIKKQLFVYKFDFCFIYGYSEWKNGLYDVIKNNMFFFRDFTNLLQDQRRQI